VGNTNPEQRDELTACNAPRLARGPRSFLRPPQHRANALCIVGLPLSLTWPASASFAAILLNDRPRRLSCLAIAEHVPAICLCTDIRAGGAEKRKAAPWKEGGRRSTVRVAELERDGHDAGKAHARHEAPRRVRRGASSSGRQYRPRSVRTQKAAGWKPAFVVVVGERWPRAISSRVANAIQMERSSPAVPGILQARHAARARSGCAHLCSFRKLLLLRLHSVAFRTRPRALTDSPGLSWCSAER
jgi:hypothetical protein